MFRSVVLPTVIIIAVVVALISISYPSVTVTNVTTQSLPGFAIYTGAYPVAYGEATASTSLVGYSTITAWYPGNPICDPTSNACTPFPTPTATLVYPQSMTYTYSVTLSSQSASSYTSEFTSFFTQTSSQNVPPYALAGLTEFQYGIMAMTIVLVLGLTLLFIFTKGRTGPSSPVRTSNTSSTDVVRPCQHCGTANPEDGEFCTNCGSRLG